MTICALLAVFFIFLPALNGAENWPPDPNAFELEWLNVTPDSTTVGPSLRPFRIGITWTF